jgi:hypothetical protein
VRFALYSLHSVTSDCWHGAFHVGQLPSTDSKKPNDMNRKNPSFLKQASKAALEMGTAGIKSVVTNASVQQTDLMQMGTNMQVRIARPTDKLEEVVAFYRDGVGMPVVYQFHDHDGYSGVMLGIPDDRIHLEFTHASGGSPCPAPTKDNLLVLYISEQQDFRKAVGRIEKAGHRPVEPENPYWSNFGKTYEDPDGWRVVLYYGKAFQH